MDVAPFSLVGVPLAERIYEEHLKSLMMNQGVHYEQTVLYAEAENEAGSTKKAAEKTNALLNAMSLQELRHARHLSQEQLAQTLSVKQAAVSKMEKRTDMYISTLRNFIKAMGGDLEITAKFPEGAIQISQFEDIASKTERGSLPNSV